MQENTIQRQSRIKADFESFVYDDKDPSRPSKINATPSDQCDKMIDNFRKRAEDITDRSKLSSNSHIMSKLPASKPIKKKAKAASKTPRQSAMQFPNRLARSTQMKSKQEAPKITGKRDTPKFAEKAKTPKTKPRKQK